MKLLRFRGHDILWEKGVHEIGATSVWDERPQSRRIKDLADDLASEEGIGSVIAQLEREVAQVEA